MSALTMSPAKRWWLGAALIGSAILTVIGAASLVVYMGAYDIAADSPHSQAVFWFMTTIRERSVAAGAKGIVAPPNLTDPKRIASGTAQYEEMCSGCHLAPGMKKTEISQGLYPRAPELRRGSSLSPAEEFWVVKHGLKMTGMPAWGVTHNDEILWDIVAFLRKMPALTADQYQALVKSASKTHDEMMRGMEMGMDHGDGGQSQH